MAYHVIFQGSPPITLSTVLKGISEANTGRWQNMACGVTRPRVMVVVADDNTRVGFGVPDEL